MADEIQAAPFEGPPFVRVQINRRGKEPVYALVDAADAHLVRGLRWHQNKDGYAVRTVDAKRGVKEPMARRVLGLAPGDGWETDHISRDKLDNRRANLRRVTHAQNAQNRLRSDGACKARGVSRRKAKKTKQFHAYGMVHGKQNHLGFYETEAEAAGVARAWRAEHMPFATD